MAERQVARRKRVKVPVGDLNNRIDIGVSVSSPRAGGKTDKTFRRSFTRFAKVETKTGTQGGGDKRLINGRNTTPPSTHAFTIRYIDGIKSQMIVCFKGDFYEIQGTTDVDGRREYLRLRARILGDITLEASEV